MGRDPADGRRSRSDWVFRGMMIVMAIAFAALVSGGMGMMVFQGLAGVGDILLPLSLLPPGIGIYMCIQVIVSCLTDDLD